MPKRSLRSVRGGKLYGAAFPMLDSLAVEQAWSKGRACCQWTNECGVVVGHVEITDLTTDKLVMTTKFLGAVNVGYRHAVDSLVIRRKRHNDNHDRPSFACPSCGRSARFVFAVVGRWGCRLCHDLVSVGQLLGSVTRYQRRIMELAVLLRRGRVRYGRKAAFDAMKEEYGRLTGEFSHAPPLAAELRFAQYAAWLAPDDPAIKREVLDDEPGYGWTRHDEGGFKRLTWIAEQEREVRDKAELATRGRRSAVTVRPLGATGPNVTVAPYAVDPRAETDQPAALRLDFSSLVMPPGGSSDDEPVDDVSVHFS